MLGSHVRQEVEALSEFFWFGPNSKATEKGFECGCDTGTVLIGLQAGPKQDAGMWLKF